LTWISRLFPATLTASYGVLATLSSRATKEDIMSTAPSTKAALGIQVATIRVIIDELERAFRSDDQVLLRPLARQLSMEVASVSKSLAARDMARPSEAAALSDRELYLAVKTYEV
jgi:hypothetical protein